MMALKILELLIICERVFRKNKKGANKTMPPLIIDYLNLIQKHYAEHHSVGFYAEKLFVHPNMLNAFCRRHLLQSAKATIDLKLIEESKSLLQNTALSVKEIAYELGFESATHFFRFFKRLAGTSPLSFRKSEFENVAK